MSIFELIAILLVLTATFGWVNQKVLRLPSTIGILVMGLGASLVLVAVDLLWPGQSIYESLSSLVGKVEFQNVLMDGMLAFLLFAGALHVDVGVLRRRAPVVGSMASVGVILSTVIVGLGFWFAARAVGVGVTLPWAFVFGALISPTDPVAVLSTLKAVDVPEELETDITGESLFNDGVGVVIFTLLVSIADGSGELSFSHVGKLFLVEAVGGGLLGLAAGYVAYRATRAIDDYPIEVLISLALVTGTYALASRLHMSGPIATVVAGLLMGNRGTRYGMSDRTEKYLYAFWTLVDETLNALLFLLIGLEVLVALELDWQIAWLALLAIPLALLARLAAVALPVLSLNAANCFARGTIPILTWGGLRGGIAIALALSVPDFEQRSVILAATYTVVVFSIVVQGLTLGRVVRRCLG